MATATKSSTAMDTPQDPTMDWDEARLQDALARVQDMHAQLRKLRNIVPSLLKPIHSDPTSPETLYADLTNAAKKAVTNVRDFQDKMREPHTKEILDRAKESKSKVPENVEPWLVSNNPNWLDQPTLRSADDLHLDDGQQKEENTEQTPTETIPQTVQKFKEANKDLDIKLEETKRTIGLIMPSAKLNFAISWDAQPKPTFKAVAKGSSKILQNITTFLSNRPKNQDLNYTLELIGCYRDIRTRKCDECNKVTDVNNEYTAVRIGNTIKNEDGTKKIQWKAYHQACEKDHQKPR